MPKGVQPVTKVTTVESFICETLQKRHELEDDPFIVVNLSEVQERFEQWQQEFPDVEPFFALKAQNNANTVKLLADNSCGFDVASLGEMKTVLEAGVPPTRMLYAQPYKQPSHLLFALEKNILSVCDSVDEIRKIGECSKQINCNPEVLIRILPDDKENDAQASLSTKFGAPFRMVDDLMNAAKESNVAVVGISFHVGSHCHSADPYLNTLRLSRLWWDRLVTDYGANLRVLDIGGGYPGERGPDFRTMSRQINSGIEEHYGDVRKNIRVIAEPGRFMVTSSLSVVANVIAVKGDAEFVLNTGVYGGLSHSMWDKRAARGSTPYLVKAELNNGSLHSKGSGHSNGKLLDNDRVGSNGVEEGFHGKVEGAQAKMVFWGPTCDSSDRLVDGYNVTGIKRGDWIVFPDLGAYCSNIMTTFNGFAYPKMHFVFTNQNGDKIEQFFQQSLLS